MIKPIGIMMSMDDAVDFFEEVSMILDNDNVETDKNFPEKYTRAMNRLRYVQRKEQGVMVKVLKGRRPIYDMVSCGKCGFDLTNSPHYNFCPNCGYEIIRIREKMQED